MLDVRCFGGRLGWRGWTEKMAETRRFEACPCRPDLVLNTGFNDIYYMYSVRSIIVETIPLFK